MKSREIISLGVVSVVSVGLSFTPMAFSKAAKSTPITGSITSCGAIETKIDEKITKFNTNQQGHVVAFGNLKTRITNLIARLDAKSIDTTKLKADQTQLNVLIEKFNTDYAAYIAKLQETQTSSCGKSSGQFRTTLKEARALLPVVRADIAAVKDYMNNTMKPDIVALRAQVAAKASATPSVTSTPTATATVAR